MIGKEEVLNTPPVIERYSRSLGELEKELAAQATPEMYNAVSVPQAKVTKDMVTLWRAKQAEVQRDRKMLAQEQEMEQMDREYEAAYEYMQRRAVTNSQPLYEEGKYSPAKLYNLRKQLGTDYKTKRGKGYEYDLTKYYVLKELRDRYQYMAFGTVPVAPLLG